MTRTYRLFVTVQIDGDTDTVPSIGAVADKVERSLREVDLRVKVKELEAEDSGGRRRDPNW